MYFNISSPVGYGDNKFQTVLRRKTLHSLYRSQDLLYLPMKNSLRMVTHLRSYKGATAPSSVPNSESIPSNTSIIKKRTAHKGDTSINKNASQYVINAKPGPVPT